MGISGMKFLTLALLFILAAIAVFIALNWGQHEEFKTGVFAKVDQLGTVLHSSLEESTNSLAACIGELEDRIDRTRGG
jgi:DNA-binding transcriptional regulator of glucitol operon